MTICTGQLGKTCTCGQVHDSSAIESPRSMLGNKWFWIFGALCVLIWSGAWELLPRLVAAIRYAT